MKQYIETPRLLLRDWKEEDLADLIRLNSDDQVMEYFLAKLSPEESMDTYNRIQEEFETYGFGIYVVEDRATGAFVGYVGLHNISPVLDFAPAVEIAWRLLPEFWNQGYATEAATACLTFAKNELKIDEIVAFTSLLNKRSERVMQKIGMVEVKEFDHPLVDPNHRLCRHVLYRCVANTDTQIQLIHATDYKDAKKNN